jgi:hypothetical protein
MTELDFRPSGEAAARWRAVDFPSKDDFAYDLTPTHVVALEQAVAAARAGGKTMTDTTRDDFPLGDAAEAIAAIGREVTQGRGFVLARGFPAERLSLDDMVWLYWGVGCHWGRAVSQSLRGDRLGHVLDARTDKTAKARGYRSSQELHFHNDSDDIVGMLCLHQGKTGGVSLLLNALAIHDTLLQENPAALARLYEGWRYDWNNQAPPGEPPITPYKVPVFSRATDLAGRDKVSVVYLRGHITDAAKALTGGLSTEDQATLDALEEMMARDEFRMEFRLASGELILFNNYTLFHARTAFTDHDDPARHRHLLRLWLQAWNRRPVHENVRRYYGPDGMLAQDRANDVYGSDTMEAVT